MPSQQKVEQLARLIASQLREQNERLAATGGGVVFVTARRDADGPELLATGTEPEKDIYAKVVEELTNGGLPIGFVKWESEEVGTKNAVRTSCQPFPFAENLGPWANEMLNLAVGLVRSGIRPS